MVTLSTTQLLSWATPSEHIRFLVQNVSKWVSSYDLSIASHQASAPHSPSGPTTKLKPTRVSSIIRSRDPSDWNPRDIASKGKCSASRRSPYGKWILTGDVSINVKGGWINPPQLDLLDLLLSGGLLIRGLHYWVVGWWNQPISNICSSTWIISRGIGVRITKIFELPPPS